LVITSRFVSTEIISTLSLCVIGDRSFVLTGSDATAIHQENTEKLSKMSAEEILQEQQRLASQLDTKLLQFIQSRRKGKQVSGIVHETVKQPSDISELSSEASSCQKMDTDLPCNSEPEVSVRRGVEGIPSQYVNPTDVSQSEDRVHISGGGGGAASENVKETGSIGLENNCTPCQADVEMSSVAVDLPIMSSEANKWLHMDVTEHEKLQWIGDIPPAAPAPPDTPYSARFDFQGRKLTL
jgi:hypothetical protein